MTKTKSRDLGPERSRCNDYQCPQWEAGCARAETHLGLGRFNWLRPYRSAKGTSCERRIDPVTLRETTPNRPAEGIVDV